MTIARSTRTRAAPSAGEIETLAREARRAVERLVIARTAAATVSPDVWSAMRVAAEAIDLLAGDEASAPHALVRVRRMHDALVATSLDTLTDAVVSAARNIRASKPETMMKMSMLFLTEARPHLTVFGVAETFDFNAGDVALILSRFKGAKPNRRRRELDAAGVFVELLVLTGVNRKAARARVGRAARVGRVVN